MGGPWHAGTLAYEPWPTYDPALTREDTVEIVVQLDGEVRSRLLAGRTPRKVIVVPGKLVNLVV